MTRALLLASVLLLCRALAHSGAPAVEPSPDPPRVPAGAPSPDPIDVLSFADAWAGELPPVYVAFFYERFQDEAVKRVQAPLASVGWKTGAWDVSACAEIAASLGVSDGGIVCFLDNEKIGVLPLSATPRDVGDVFAEYTAETKPPLLPAVNPFDGGEWQGEMVFVHAKWCVNCPRYKPVIERMKADGLPIREVDYDATPAIQPLAPALPAFIFMRFQNGEVQPVRVYYGEATEQILRDAFKRLIPKALPPVA